MKGKKNILLFSIAMLSITLGIQAQDTISKTVTLGNVDILHTIREEVVNPGLIIEKADSLQQSRFATGTLADLLGQNGMVYLKQYGAGSLAVTSLRGASATQTPVLWNGINLQSPTNGNVDLSLMPAILCDNISIQNGGGSAGWGSGAIGGVIQTGNVGSYNKGINVKYVGQAGSFREQNHGIKIGYSNTKMYADVRAYRQVAANDFTYVNKASYIIPQPIDTMENSYFFQEGIMGQVGWTTKSEKHFFAIRSWYQSSVRGIPPPMGIPNYEDRQKDEFFRTVASWKMYLKKLDIEMKSALMTEFMDYYMGFNFQSSYTHATSIVNEADGRYRISKKSVATLGLNSTYMQADVTDYVPVTMENHASVFGSFQYLPTEMWNFVLNLRDEEVNGEFTPLIGSVGMECYPKKYLTLKSSISKNYRLPTFNELYWVPGGNPDLKPEESRNFDLSGELHLKKNNLLINYSVTGFYRFTDNWIQWQPTSNALIWSPKNVLQVWSRGFNHRLKMEWKWKKIVVSFLGSFNYVLSTTMKSDDPFDPTINKQMIYVPTYDNFGMLQISYMKFYLAYQHRYTDIRFTSADHSSDLPAFDLAGITIGKRIDYKNSCGDLYFRINNLFNEDYQSYRNMPTPGRSFQVGVTIDFNMSKKSKE